MSQDRQPATNGFRTINFSAARERLSATPLAKTPFISPQISVDSSMPRDLEMNKEINRRLEWSNSEQVRIDRVIERRTASPKLALSFRSYR